MEQRSTVFVEAMIVIAVIGVLAFLISLIARMPQARKAGASATAQPESSPRWHEFTLALILLAAIAAFAIWLISSGTQWAWGETIGDWRADTRAITFAAVMVGLAVIGLVVSLAYALVQSSQGAVPTKRPADTLPAAETAPASAAAAPSEASPLRLLGLLVPVVAIVLLCWIYLSYALQFSLLANLIYPASLGVTLVLLFDKATRTWSTKSSAESFREWLACDLLVFLLVLAFLNLCSIAKPDTYAASFFDLLNIVLFFIAFWVLDRTAARSRFLVGYAYLIILPLGLLIWQSVQGAAGAATWWGSLWPFVILAAVFFVLEAVTVFASSGERQTLPAVKDTVFTVAYAVLLIVAAKSG